MYPVAVDLDYEVERNRLTTFFRLLVSIPWILWLYLYGIAALIVVVIAWFAVLFTKRFPEGLYGFLGGYVAVSTQIGGFISLATDEWPPFTPSAGAGYPLSVDVGPQQVEYRRSRTFFKAILAFPQQVLLFGLGYVLMGAAFVTWWRVLFTGRQSATMHEAIRTTVIYSGKAQAFSLLLTEVHPRLLDVPQQQIPADAPSMPGPQQLPAGGGALEPG